MVDQRHLPDSVGSAFDDLINLKMILLLFFVEIIEKMRMNVGGIRLVFFVGVSVDFLIHHHHQSSESDLMISCGPRRFFSLESTQRGTQSSRHHSVGFQAHLKKIEKVESHPGQFVQQLTTGGK